MGGMDAANDGTNTLTFLALGDSYTIGEAVPEEGRWPVQLARTLREEGVALGEPRIVATTGWTTDELEWGIDAAEPLGTFDFVSLLIGVNNQYRNRSAVAYAAAHVVCDPLADNNPTGDVRLDWDATLVYRRHLCQAVLPHQPAVGRGRSASGPVLVAARSRHGRRG